jgi:1,4-dihydroxy-2-naphthoyl-CoA hydrolase
VLVSESTTGDDLARAAAGGDAAALVAYLDYLRARIATRGVHLGSHLGIETLEVRPDHVVMRMAYRPELRRGGGVFHGGAIMALGDQVAGCLFNTDPRIAAAGETGLTTDFNVTFLKALAPGEGVRATGKVLRRGRQVTFMQIDIAGEEGGTPVAVCRTTYLTVPRAKLPRVG